MTDAAGAMSLLLAALPLRHTASHALNDASSRSHAIFSLQVYRKRTVHRLTETERGKWRYVPQPERESISFTRANLVDLAGSEDARDSKAEGATLREASDINKSLFTLRKVRSRDLHACMHAAA